MIKYQKGVASVAFNGFDQLPTSQQPVSVNMTFYPKLIVSPFSNLVRKVVNVG